MKEKGGITAEDVDSLSSIEHILKLPDMYVGDIQTQNVETWICKEVSESGISCECAKVSIPMGAYKICDEILVNSRDASVIDSAVFNIWINVTKDGMITVKNDGHGIDTSIHEKSGLPTPQVVFGNLRAGSNFNKKEGVKATTGGRNGYGAKLTNVFSDEFCIDILDMNQVQTKGKAVHYTQKWSNNMRNVEKPITSVRPIKGRDSGHVKITYKIGEVALPTREISDDFMAVLRRRALDLAACTPKSVQVHFNDTLVEVDSFMDYVDAFIGVDTPRVGISDNGWDVVIALAPENGPKKRVISFVNGIFTQNGGKHVEYIIHALEDNIRQKLDKRTKTENKNVGTIIGHMFYIFVNATVDDPTFSSQTKDYMTKHWSIIKSKIELPERFFKALHKDLDFMDMLERRVAFDKAASASRQYKQIGSRYLNIPKLEDANNAGKQGQHNVLMLTEGDSAKTFAVTGLAVTGRSNFGVFPLKGKPINVSAYSESKVLENDEYKKLVRIIGLKENVEYTSERIKKELRYQEVWVISDADADGLHIRGLVIEMFRVRFPSLFTACKDFMKVFTTPCVSVVPKVGSAKRKLEEQTYFFSENDFKKWFAQNNTTGKDVFYWKGLGSIPKPDALELFKTRENRLKRIRYEGEEDDEAMQLAFDKSKADERKNWLNESLLLGDEAPTADLSLTHWSMSYIVNRELIIYGKEKNIHTLPSLMDGLKSCSRKIVQYFLAHPGVSKVVNAAGLISSKYHYHHGESSMYGAIINLNQSYLGSNQYPLLQAHGQFGSRLMGGADHASPRYLSTSLSAFSTRIFSSLDMAVLPDTYVDGEKAEKQFLAPIIPLALVNRVSR